MLVALRKRTQARVCSRGPCAIHACPRKAVAGRSSRAKRLKMYIYILSIKCHEMARSKCHEMARGAGIAWVGSCGLGHGVRVFLTPLPPRAA